MFTWFLLMAMAQADPPIESMPAPSTTPIIHPICTSSVIWGDNYQIVHNLIVKHRSIRAQHPQLPHIVLAANDVPDLAIQLMKEEGMTVKPITHVEYTAENRESGFEKIMTKLRALELKECEWVVQMDIDMIVLRSIVDAVAECDTGGYDLCGVPQSPSCVGRECCTPLGNGNILHVLVVNTGFMVYRPGGGLQKKLFETLKATKAPREQTLWGQMICTHPEVKVHMLERKFNIWTDLSWVPDIHVLHYGIGPAYLGGDMVPLTNNRFYQYHHGFDYYRRLSLGVDSCAQWLDEDFCLKEPSFERDPTEASTEFIAAMKPSEFYPKCEWKEDRCIDNRYSGLFVDDKDDEMQEIVDGNAALHCAIRDNPVGAIRMINNCGMFCSYALHFEDYCDVNFSFFHCVGLMLNFMTDYRAYATLWVGMWISCLPAVYVWCLRVGFMLVLSCFCGLLVTLWHVSMRVCKRVARWKVVGSMLPKWAPITKRKKAKVELTQACFTSEEEEELASLISRGSHGKPPKAKPAKPEVQHKRKDSNPITELVRGVKGTSQQLSQVLGKSLWAKNH